MPNLVLSSAGGAALVLSTALQGPPGALASPTATGFVHVTSGTIDGAARAVNLSTADVTGLLPAASMAPGTNTYVLTTVGGVATWAAGGSVAVVQLSQDVL